MHRRAPALALALALAAGCSPTAAPRPTASDTTRGLAAHGAGSGADAPPGESPLTAPAERLEVPGFNGATAWLNVDHPLTLDELRGRVVVVDFWTSCCINCMHALPTLAAIEARFRDEPVVVVGVHSPKFDEERDPARLRDAIAALGIEHPVALDASMTIWDGWGVRGWPTIAVLDTEGRVAWADSGEPDRAELEGVIRYALAEARASKKIATTPLRGLRPEHGAAGPLRYPGKVLALADGGLAIADSGHDRVVLTDRGGTVTAVIGDGVPGASDGDFTRARFQRPQGMTEAGDDLYVADTGNHLIRRIDRKARTVTTVAGTGVLGPGPLAPAEAPARKLALRSPWDVLYFRGSVYVALAGSHQIGVLDPKAGLMRLYAGSGLEARVDGTALEAAFAQPSALATDGRELFVLDSETSSVRAIELATAQVRTLVGLDLFEFGDIDGDAKTTRLQHPIGMAFGNGALWVADSYNGKVKRVDPGTGQTRTVLVGLGEPAGITVAGGDLVVADTHHHRIVRRAITATGQASPLAIANLSPPAPPLAPTPSAAGPVLSLGRLRAPRSTPSAMHFEWALPEGTSLNDEAPVRLAWTSSRGLARAPDAVRTTGARARGGLDVTLEPSGDATAAALEGTLTLVICDEIQHRVCVPVERTIKVDLALEPGAPPARATIPMPRAE
jgi:thiol-disulfide isomerase/thioredoxin/sugar lactone lactonase YvrE